MSQVLDMFSRESNGFELTGIKTLAKVLHYHPDRESSFLSGLILAKDLQSDQEVTLYTSGTPITHKRVTRLLHLHENNPGWDLNFKLKRTAQLIESFKNDITAKIKKLVEFRKNYKVYDTLLGTISDELNAHIDDILSDENITLELYKMKYLADSSECKGATKFFNHTASVIVFSFALSKEKDLAKKIDFSSDDHKNLMKAAFFHNIGAVLEVDPILKALENKREKLYHHANRNSVSLVEKIKMSIDSLKAIKYVNENFFGGTNVASHEDNKSIWMANIIIVVDKYLQLESGLFSEKVKPSQIIDQLNVEAVNKILNKNVVKAITNGLGMTKIAGFYLEIEKLLSLCTFAGGGHSWPYPVTGFKSPTLFVCKRDHFDCPHYETSVKAVSLVKSFGQLKEGKYARCKEATPKLHQYYNETKGKQRK
ncbi:hypothetical protein IIB79_10940 [candidate division KSB1 bacterium]|nr:hypothetical protein [candidate division KSB1 bacterium]